MRHIRKALIAVLVLAFAGCPGEIWLTTRLHVLPAEQGAFTNTGEPGIYTLTLNGAADTVTWFTDRPRREIGIESLEDFATNTWLQVLAGESPTGAIAYQDADGYWSMAPFKALGLDAGSDANSTIWQLEMKGAPDSGTLRDVHLYLDDRGADETGEGDSYVFLHGAAHIAFEPQAKANANANAYTLRLSYPYPTVSVMETNSNFAVYQLPVAGYVETVWSGDFTANPPNAAIQVEGLDGATRVVIAVLSNPVYDPETDELTYTVEPLSEDPDITEGPGVLFIDDWSDDDDTTIYKVVVNYEEQYSIWPADRENPPGWNDVGVAGTKAECLAYIKEVWTEMRPLSLRKKMEEMERGVMGGVVNVSTSGDVTILEIRGRLTIGEGDVELRNAVQDALDRGAQRIVLDLSDVSQMDSSGIGGLVRSFTSAISRHAVLVLANVPLNVMNILTITHLDTIFQIYNTVEEAVAALGS